MRVIELNVAPDRADDKYREATGIYVRAKAPDGRWVSADIAQLDVASLNTFLRSRGGENEWAEAVVRILLGHDGGATADVT